MANNLSRRNFLAIGGSAATLPAMVLAAPGRNLADPVRFDETFMALFTEWKRVRYIDHAPLTEAQSDVHIRRYAELCDVLCRLPTFTERQFAIQYHVATDAGDSFVSALFDKRMRSLLTSQEVAPC